MRGGDAIIAFNRAVGNSNAIKAPFPRPFGASPVTNPSPQIVTFGGG